MEYLDIVDENGVPTGKIAERTAAHKQGLRHRTSHVWILRERAGKVEVLLQKRSQNKDSFPGCYDISSAGHIPAGVDFIPSALRELKEELGCSVSENELIYCGQRRFSYDGVFHGKEFHDRQVSKRGAFLYQCAGYREISARPAAGLHSLRDPGEEKGENASDFYRI